MALLLMIPFPAVLITMREEFCWLLFSSLDTGSLSVALTVLELAMENRLACNS